MNIFTFLSNYWWWRGICSFLCSRKEMNQRNAPRQTYGFSRNFSPGVVSLWDNSYALWYRHPIPHCLHPARLDHEPSTAPFLKFFGLPWRIFDEIWWNSMFCGWMRRSFLAFSSGGRNTAQVPRPASRWMRRSFFYRLYRMISFKKSTYYNRNYIIQTVLSSSVTSWHLPRWGRQIFCLLKSFEGEFEGGLF